MRSKAEVEAELAVSQLEQPFDGVRIRDLYRELEEIMCPVRIAMDRLVHLPMRLDDAKIALVYMYKRDAKALSALADVIETREESDDEH